MRVPLPAVRLGMVATGFVLYATATAFSSAKDASVKYLSLTLPISQILSARLLGDLFPALLLLLLSREAGALRPSRLGLHLVRALCMAGTMVLLYSSIRGLPLAQAIALFMLGPVFMAVLSRLLRHEPLALAHRIACLLGLTGAYVVIQPATADIGLLHVLPVMPALCYACVTILSRELGRDNGTVAITLYGSLGLLICLPLGTYSSWVVPSPDQAYALAALAVTGGLSSFFYVAGCRRAPLAIVAPLDYLCLIWAGLWGYALWSEAPKSSVWLGGILIVAAIALSSRTALVRSADAATDASRGKASPEAILTAGRADRR